MFHCFHNWSPHKWCAWLNYGAWTAFVTLNCLFGGVMGRGDNLRAVKTLKLCDRWKTFLIFTQCCSQHELYIIIWFHDCVQFFLQTRWLQAKTCVCSREDKVTEFMEEEVFLGTYVEIWEFPSHAVLRKKCYQPCLPSCEPLKLHAQYAQTCLKVKINGWEFSPLVAAVDVNTRC